ncbi:uncharacterized protein HMPREF1541_10540 [Cyphellophora europaea CBS 101466]|uniref:Uncharacterized protein n=1 Tax=Cyphellophora europaea (strain CBS 101466) TaxID=1220924 RepID=W2S6W0_CYPE1|nr:uncharacterized protein HMPREF1541_10540 [Cyphellophora europaea CBS 101466]ETN44360.1 hypothetical protein HMPREF1541_10540 [Cyphellophora europaea CBS 101466]
MLRKFSIHAIWPKKKTQVDRLSVSSSGADAFQVALLLRDLPLPPDVIPNIIDLAGFRAHAAAVANDCSQVVSERNSGIVHAVTPIPSHIHRPSIRSVIFTVTSHDQGWSWDKANHGTYQNSSTWFEAGLLLPQTSVPTLQNCRRIITNVHASKEDKMHRVEWFHDDPDPYIQLIFRRLREGEAIGINVCAMFRGWQNLVQQSSIAFTFQPVRKVP